MDFRIGPQELSLQVIRPRKYLIHAIVNVINFSWGETRFLGEGAVIFANDGGLKLLYSYRNASTGFIRDAFRAGIIPNINPHRRVTPNPKMMAIGEI